MSSPSPSSPVVSLTYPLSPVGSKQLSGKVAIVTGASSGIGRATAVAFALEGAKVIAAARNEERLQSVVDEIKKAGGQAAYIIADVSKEEDNKKIVEFAVQTYGGLHVVFNNAGIFSSKSIPDIDAGHVDDLINTNIKSIIWGLKYQIPALLASGNSGSVINNSSMLGLHNRSRISAGASIYSATKSFVNALSQVAAIENAGRIRVNAVLPAIIKTPIAKLNEEQTDQWAAPLHLAGRAGTGDEVANVVVFLASDKAAFVTGSLYEVSGGFQVI